VHDAIDGADGIIINPAGLTFTSVALMDSLKMFDGPKIELHITNVHAREEIYHRSLVSRTATAVMAGFGTNGYLMAVDWMAERLGSPRHG
jgi:3-dehydroquinate dehydratase II